MQISDAMIEAARSAVILGEDADGKPVYLSASEARAVIFAALSTDAEPVKTNHPDDLAVDRFAAAMKMKLAKKRLQGFGGWDNPEVCHIDYLAHLLKEQIHSRAALNTVDIGNFAMMIFNRGETPNHGR